MAFNKKSNPNMKNKDKKKISQGTNKFNDFSKDGRRWYESEIPKDPEDFPQASKEVLQKLINEADAAMEEENVKYKQKMSFSSDYNWRKTVMSKGTSSDKIASYTLSIQDSPFHNLPLLENLVNMVKMGKRKDCFTVIETLSELFIEDLIPKDWVKLRPFSYRPLALIDSLSNGKPSLRKKILLTWKLEDELKKVFSNFVTAVCEVAAKDSVEKNRMEAIAALYKLLANVAEKEDVILSNLVNKLGDPNQKVSSKVMHCLKLLLQKHPNMKTVVKEEVEKLIFRHNISSKAQFYGLCFLSQYYFSEDDEELAKSLIKLYFSFFKACIKKGEIDTRLMGALLTGVKRAYPYSKLKAEDESLMEHLQTVHKVVHLGSFNISVHALSLLLQVMDCSSDVISDRFYTALYKKILDPQLASSNLQAMFLSISFKALKNDTEVHRKKAFVKRFLEVCHYIPVPLACGVLYLVSEILRNCPDPLSLKFNSSSNLTDDKAKNIVVLDDDDDYEHYVDIKTEDDTEVKIKFEEVEIKTEKEIKTEDDITELANVKKENDKNSSWVHRSNKHSDEKATIKKLNNGHDPYQRNPRYAVTPSCTYSELIRLSQHFHPTVALFAQKLSVGEYIDYTGDPLQDFALLRFLNRFAFKNPKKQIKKQEDEDDKLHHPLFRKKYAPQGIKALPLTSDSYLSEKEENIPVDELFLYKYVHQRRKEKMKFKTEDHEESDNDSVDSDEFEEVMQKFMGGKKNIEVDEDVDFADGVGFDNDSEDGADSKDGIVSKKKKLTKKKSKALKRKITDDESSNSSESDDDDSGDDDLSNVFASAEEFSELLQETGSSHLDTTSGSGLSNKDNAAAKQLNWELSRDKWLKGVDKFSKKSGSFTRKSKMPRKKPKMRKK